MKHLCFKHEGFRENHEIFRSIKYPYKKKPPSTYLGDPLNETVVSIDPFMRAGEPFETGILGDPQGNSVLCSEPFQLADDAVRYIRYAFCVQTIHHCLDDVQLVKDREIDEICVHEYPIRWPKLLIVFEIER